MMRPSRSRRTAGGGRDGLGGVGALVVHADPVVERVDLLAELTDQASLDGDVVGRFGEVNRLRAVIGPQPRLLASTGEQGAGLALAPRPVGWPGSAAGSAGPGARRSSARRSA
jgi:hypothetical protein